MINLDPLPRGDKRYFHAGINKDLAGGVVRMAIMRAETDADDAETTTILEGVLDAPDAEGKIYGATLELTAAQSQALAEPLPARNGKLHVCCRAWFADGDVKTISIATLPIIAAAPRAKQ